MLKELPLSRPTSELMPAEAYGMGDEVARLPNGVIDHSDIDDVFRLGSDGRGHRTSKVSQFSNGKTRNGQFATNYEMGMIAANQTLIRDGLAGIRAEIKMEDRTELLPGPLENQFSDLMVFLRGWGKLAAQRESSIVTVREATGGKVEDARKNYEQTRRQAKIQSANKLDEFGLEPNKRLTISQIEDENSATRAGLNIRDNAINIAKQKGFLASKREEFHDWWARRGGGKFFSRNRLVGTTQKVGVMIGVSLPVAVAAGVSDILVAGPLAGAVVTAGVSRSVAHGLARARVSKNTGAKSVADAQYEKRQEFQIESIDKEYAQNGLNHIPYSVTDIYAEGTRRSISRNRRRAIGSIAIGAIVGMGGGLLGGVIHQDIWTSNKHATEVTMPSPRTLHHNHLPAHQEHKPVHQIHITPKPHQLVEPHLITGSGVSNNLLASPASSSRRPSNHSSVGHITGTGVSTPTTSAHLLHHHAFGGHQIIGHGSVGQEFYVKPGAGEISEIQQYAMTHNYHVTAADAYRIYVALYSRYGTRIINLDGPGLDTYVISDGDIGLSHPGEAHWYPGIEAVIRHKLATSNS